MKTAISRIGVITTIVGAGAMVSGLVVSINQSLNKAPPPRPEFEREWSERKNKEEMQELACRLDWSKCSDSVRAQVIEIERRREEFGNIIDTMPFDPGAKWTPRQKLENVLTGVIGHVERNGSSWWERATFFGSRLLLAGLFLWLLWDITAGRLLSWVRHGSTPGNR